MTEQQRQQTYAQMLVRLSRSNFRSRFHLKAQDKQYIRDKGWNTIADHAADFVSKRLAPAEPKNDGKQTPMRGHPVFIAQHATAAAVWRSGTAFRRACRFRRSSRSISLEC